MFEKYENLLLRKPYEALTAEEKQLVAQYGDAEAYNRTREMLLKTKENFRNDNREPSPELYAALKKNLPTRKPTGFSWIYLFGGGLAILLGGLFTGYYFGKKAVQCPETPLKTEKTVEYATLYDTIYKERIVEKTVKTIKYVSAPNHVKRTDKDSIAMVSNTGRSLEQDRDLLRFVDRTGI